MIAGGNQAIFQNESRDSVRREPVSHLASLVVRREAFVASAGSNDDRGSVTLPFLGGKDRQARLVHRARAERPGRAILPQRNARRSRSNAVITASVIIGT